jgi:hypothetical protein
VDLLIRRFNEVSLGHAFFLLLLFREGASSVCGTRMLFLSP